MRMKATGGERGQVLIGVVLVLMALLIMVPALVQWVQQESKISVKDKKSAGAFNLPCPSLSVVEPPGRRRSAGTPAARPARRAPGNFPKIRVDAREYPYIFVS